VLVQSVYSLTAALMLASAAVLQHGEARRQPADVAFSPKLLQRLARRPVWLLGLSIELVAVIAEALALRAGPVVTMQAVKSTSVAFALVFAARRNRRRLAPIDVLLVIALIVAIAGFVTAASPTASIAPTSPGPWLAAVALTIAIGGSALFASRFVAPRSRAIMIGVATGAIWALTAVLLKATAIDVQRRGYAAIDGWAPSALVAGGLVGTVVNQTAFQAGELSWSLPAMSVVEPVAGALLGAVVYHEHFIDRTDGSRFVLLASGAVALTCVVLLDRARDRTGSH
jgi:drug/metabolite transporter (DMT)-like permease